MENQSFKVLNAININDKIKSKIGLSYLSWAYAWGELLEAYPDATMKVYTREIETTETLTSNDDGLTRTITNKSTQEIPYFTDGKSCFVKIGVTIQGIEYVEYYPIMGLKNEAIRASMVTMTDVNKAIQRGFVKCCARHGLGLYIYAGEDLPEAEKNLPIVLNGGETFEAAQEDVITLVKKLTETKAQEEVARYITEVFQGVRLSQTTDADLDKLLAAREYLTGLYEQFGK